ncbi:MAG: SufD family Fe-S cluster assembly protein, partial [Thermoprotei archaeon]
ETRGESISRVVSSSGSKVVSRGTIVAASSPARGHLECRGLILDDSSMIQAVPELIGMRRDVDLSHEAAVGKIAEHEIAYLMSRGLSREDAVSTIVRGFLNVEMLGLPLELTREMNAFIHKLARAL